MSPRSIAAALAVRDLRPIEKLTLVALADLANPASQCWPTHSVLADRVGCSAKSIARALGHLEHVGHITRSAGPMKGLTTCSVHPKAAP